MVKVIHISIANLSKVVTYGVNITIAMTYEVACMSFRLANMYLNNIVLL